MGPYSSNLVDIVARVVGETEKAFRITDGKRTVWVPKSKVEINHDDGTITMPTWLAEEKELV
jgi:RNase P/RNase MRP subunit p29